MIREEYRDKDTGEAYIIRNVVDGETTVNELAQVTNKTVRELCWFLQRVVDSGGELAVDAEPVVRCRDCKYSEDTEDYQDTYFCRNEHHNAQVLVHSREYCSHGKKMKGADDED